MLLVAGGSAGELRSWYDALNRANGYEVTYPDQSDTQYVGDIKWIAGVENGEGFQKLVNTGDNYSEVKVEHPDESRAKLTINYNESSTTIWEWYNDLEVNQRIIKIRELMKDIAWAVNVNEEVF